ncbi:hypothetical protein HYH03_013964 [Edaphochlamys debaryana]|uniref:Uncharacterized protein n=1 Tax=Edaphochlamys debaryana TaxID=47281 RepID=A0A835XPR6_9CHLO|nr:hypothetical protein HYH03_013964 [Edaphochlamys debaryana]|eukprot:KAG2487395.1 hypothetical protein HYH03_013964 [Edaphochlamys debaryana]
MLEAPILRISAPSRAALMSAGPGPSGDPGPPTPFTTSASRRFSPAPPSSAAAANVTTGTGSGGGIGSTFFAAAKSVSRRFLSPAPPPIELPPPSFGDMACVLLAEDEVEEPEWPGDATAALPSPGPRTSPSAAPFGLPSAPLPDMAPFSPARSGRGNSLFSSSSAAALAPSSPGLTRATSSSLTPTPSAPSASAGSTTALRARDPLALPAAPSPSAARSLRTNSIASPSPRQPQFDGLFGASGGAFSGPVADTTTVVSPVPKLRFSNNGMQGLAPREESLTTHRGPTPSQQQAGQRSPVAEEPAASGSETRRRAGGLMAWGGDGDAGLRGTSRSHMGLVASASGPLSPTPSPAKQPAANAIGYTRRPEDMPAAPSPRAARSIVGGASSGGAGGPPSPLQRQKSGLAVQPSLPSLGSVGISRRLEDLPAAPGPSNSRALAGGNRTVGGSAPPSVQAASGQPPPLRLAQQLAQMALRAAPQASGSGSGACSGPPDSRVSVSSWAEEEEQLDEWLSVLSPSGQAPAGSGAGPSGLPSPGGRPGFAPGPGPGPGPAPARVAFHASVSRVSGSGVIGGPPVGASASFSGPAASGNSMLARAPSIGFSRRIDELPAAPSPSHSRSLANGPGASAGGVGTPGASPRPPTWGLGGTTSSPRPGGGVGGSQSPMRSTRRLEDLPAAPSPSNARSLRAGMGLAGGSGGGSGAPSAMSPVARPSPTAQGPTGGSDELEWMAGPPAASQRPQNLPLGQGPGAPGLGPARRGAPTAGSAPSWESGDGSGNLGIGSDFMAVEEL